MPKYGPSIITDGLVVLLDSQNPQSYPGSGNVWYDLSGYGHNADLRNFSGPGAGSTSGFDTNTGLMMFDRHVGAANGDSNNHGDIVNTSVLDQCLSQNGMTVEVWLRMDTYTCGVLTKWDGSWELYYCSNLVHRTQGSLGTTSISTGIPHTTHLGNFHQVVATHDGANAMMHINGVEVLNTANAQTGQNTSQHIGIGAYHGGAYALIGAIPLYKVYNRPLTTVEIVQNFNAVRGRYGI